MLIGMQSDTARLRRIRWAVRGALVLGIAASIAANVLHAEPNAVARAIAAWPPAALLITLELIARVPVHRRGLAAVRFAATATIGGIAAWVSYWHMAAVASRYGEQPTAAHLIPFSVDGLVVVASVCLVELAGRIRDAMIDPLVAPLPTPAPTPEPVNPAPVQHVPPAQMPEQSRTRIEPEPDAEPRRLTRAEIEAERAARRAEALAALALPEPDVEAIAADAGVSADTLRRWADDTARAARRPRGGPRKTAAEPAATDVDAGMVPVP